MRGGPAWPAAFLFDMDGLLLDTERVALQAFRDVTGPLGVDAGAAEAFFLRQVGTSSAHTYAELCAFLPGADHAELDAAWTRAFHARLDAGVPQKPHVGKILRHLAAGGAAMAVVTSTYGDAARRHLAKAGILDLFARVAGGDEVLANKPDPAPYLEAAAALGVEAAECLAFEDSDRGIASAVAAGCCAVQIPDLRPVGQPLPDLGQLVAADLREAMELVGVMAPPAPAT